MPVDKACRVCGGTFTVKPYRSESAKYCSRECSSQAQSSKVELDCNACGDSFEVKPNRQDSARFCSWDCYTSQIQLECEYCGKTYQAPRCREERKFCSAKCRYQGDRARETLTCENCGDPFEVKQSWAEDRRCCSTDCFAELRNTRVSVECEVCGDTFEVKSFRAGQARFCSKGCNGEWQSENWVGENAPRWYGGYEDYYGPNWRGQRRRALERDDRQCVICGIDEDAHKNLTGKSLHVHHKTPFRSFESYGEANQLENLMTACRSCHRQLEPVSQARVEGVV